MFQRVRKHLTPSTFIAFIALVFAITGGAFAASGGSGGGGGAGAKATAAVTHGNALASVAKSKAKPKAKAGPRGPAGPAGKNGANGTNGAPGATGPAGPAGPAGAGGVQGPQGPQGSAGANGTNGTNGTTGFTKELPKGATETGDWTLVAIVPGAVLEGQVVSSVSFNIPLGAAPTPVYNRAGETKEHCTGNVEEPGAEEGYLCVFAKAENNTETEISGLKFPNVISLGKETPNYAAPAAADPTGFGLITLAHEAGLVQVAGTWAVTAE